MVGCVFLRSIVLATSTGDDPPLARTDAVGDEAPGGRRAVAGPAIGRCETCDGGKGRGRVHRVDSLAFAGLWGVIPAPGGRCPVADRQESHTPDPGADVVPVTAVDVC